MVDFLISPPSFFLSFINFSFSPSPIIMLTLARDLLKKSQDRECEIKPLTVAFWSDFMANPSVMYNLFAPTPRKLNYDPDKVKVMGTKDGMIK